MRLLLICRPPMGGLAPPLDAQPWLNQNGAHTELPFAILNPKLASRLILALGFILVMAWMLAAAPE
jgi:hypothetical protein